MKINTLQLYAKLKQQLTDEKSQLEARLHDINQVLGSEPAAALTTAPAAATPAAAPAVPVARRAGRRGNAMSMREAITRALAERGPLSRKELGEAVYDLGYRSKAKNPLGAMGIVLYAKDSPFGKKEGKFYLPSGVQPAATESNGQTQPGATKRKFKRSAAARARMSQAQKASWAGRRKKG
jgi:hypothetical protein